MKKILLVFLGLFMLHTAQASTSITTSSISGHWTISGSPYLIYNNVVIDSLNSLTIDPGVSVIFQGTYYIEVYGILHASGTSTLPIIFTVSDTTGWDTDIHTSAGGWRGINFYTYGGIVPDTSILEYCNVNYTKLDSTSNAHTFPTTLYICGRNISVLHCNISNNKTTANCLVYMIFCNNSQVEFSYCNYFNNLSHNSHIFNVTGMFLCHDDSISNNKNGYLFYVDNLNMVFENNVINNNSSLSAPIIIYGNNAVIRKNKFYNNISGNAGAINGGGGQIDISGNYICNNVNTLSGCGAVEGGAIKLNSGPSYTFYKVKNNIISNNYDSGAAGVGGGIQIYDANANISNNQIINNYSMYGAGICIFGDSSQQVVVKNNIFFGNYTGYSPASSITKFSSGYLQFDHNWMGHPLNEEILILGTPLITGDTTTNIIGSDPGMIAPTLSTSALESALTANFGLLPTSPCISRGDTTGAFCDSIDYAGNPRIDSGGIDIGAYEYFHPVSEKEISIETEDILAIYPNPASNFIIVKTVECIGNIEIKNIQGKTVTNVPVTNKFTFIDTHTLSPGIYVASCKIRNILKSKKFIIE